MDRHISDEQVDRAIAGFLVERRDEVVRSATSSEQAAARVTREGVAGTRGGHRARTVVLIPLLVVLLAGAAMLAGGRLLGPSPRPSPSPSPQPTPMPLGAFTPTGSTTHYRENPTATLLKDGRVLVVGGYGAGPLAEVWDPGTGVFSPAGELSQEREGPTATLLQDGRVLVVGGQGPGGDLLRSAEVWDPTSMTFGGAGSLAVARSGMTAELLPDGRVLVGPSGSAEVWDPATMTFSPAGSLADGRLGDGIVLSDGRMVTITGGSATLTDPATGATRPAGVLAQTRRWSTATRLLDDRVLVAGGAACLEGSKTADIGHTAGGCTFSDLDTAELWDPATSSFRPTGLLTTGRSHHAATLLLDGRVLLVGGSDDGDGTSAEVFALK